MAKSPTVREYGEMNKRASGRSKSHLSVPRAFVVGGLICTIGELLLNLYAEAGMDLLDAGTLTSITLVFLSAVLTGIGVYDRIAKFGGAGSLVPITGFANAVVAPALDFKAEGFVLGLGAKLFIIAGPVILYGTTASVVYGLILCLFRMY